MPESGVRRNLGLDCEDHFAYYEYGGVSGIGVSNVEQIAFIQEEIEVFEDKKKKLKECLNGDAAVLIHDIDQKIKEKRAEVQEILSRVHHLRKTP